MQHNFRLGQVVQIGFGSIFCVMVVLGVISKLTTLKLISSSEWVAHTYQVEASLTDIENLLVDAETGQRGYLLTQESQFLEPYNAASQDFDSTFEQLNRLIQDNPAQQERLSAVRQLAKQRMQGFADTIALAQDGKRQSAINIVSSGEGKQLMDEIRTKLVAMVEIEDALLKERQTQANQAALWSDLASIGGTLTAIAFGLLVLGFISREIVRPINQVAQAIASSSSEIAATVEQQERTTTHQASSVNQTTSTMDELSASAQQSAQQAETASIGAQQVLSLASQGNQAVDRTLNSMDSLSSKVSAVADQIMRLSEQTNQIGSISGLVSDLANQTNMLA
ncbi:MAG TPA: CHASE3 domain-containing protein, partial [Allocoleopsis sp.]